MKRIWKTIGVIVAVLGIIGTISVAALYMDKIFTNAAERDEVILEAVQEVKVSNDSLSKGLDRYKAETNAHREAKKEKADNIDRSLNQIQRTQEVLIENQPNPEEIVNEIRRKMIIHGVSPVEPIDTAEVR